VTGTFFEMSAPSAFAVMLLPSATVDRTLAIARPFASVCPIG